MESSTLLTRTLSVVQFQREADASPSMGNSMFGIKGITGLASPALPPRLHIENTRVLCQEESSSTQPPCVCVRDILGRRVRLANSSTKVQNKKTGRRDMLLYLYSRVVVPAAAPTAPASGSSAAACCIIAQARPRGALRDAGAAN